MGPYSCDTCSLDCLTCDLDQHGSALHPGCGVIVAVPCPATVIPRLLWANLAEDEGTSAVSEDIVMEVGLNMGVQIGVRGKGRVIQDPREERESSHADSTMQSRGGHYGIDSVQIFHFHFRVASDWHWMNRREREGLK